MTKKPESHLLGQAAESAAATHLKQKGYRILGQNVRLPNGELDLIAQSGKTLVFVEVKARRSTHYGGATHAITSSKKQRIITLAAQYLAQHRLAHQLSRFDVIVCYSDVNNRLHLTHIENAFEVPGEDLRW